MLNRYGLVDINKILKEQEPGEEPPPEASPEEEQPAGEEEGGEPAPPAPPAEDPDEKIDKARDENQAQDLASFRKKHSDIIYRVAQENDPADYGWINSLASLQQKFEKSGNDEPFFMIFDPATSGLSGRKHLSFVASMQHRGRVSGNKIRFLSAGDASEFVEEVPAIRDDLEFKISESDPTVVEFKTAAQEQSEAPPVE